MASDKPIVTPKRGTLAAVVGLVTAALLLTHTPTEESGRTVKVEVAQDGAAKVTHVSGRQYLTAYLDIVGVATACDGITRYGATKVKKGDRFTEAQCAAMLEQELIVHAQGVMRCTPGLSTSIPGRDRARFAAVSLAYNVGVKAYCGSTARRRFNEGRIGEGCNAMTLWNKAGGKVVSGLVKRRERERKICALDA